MSLVAFRLVDATWIGRYGTAMAPSSTGLQPDLIHGGGAIGDLIRTFDWSTTPLGAIEDWPPTVRVVNQMLLQSRVPMVALWGPEGIMVYNQGYAEICGPRHPAALGRAVREAWPEAVDFNGEVLRRGFAGEALSFREQELELWRHGVPEQVWMDLDYTPVLDGTGAVIGIFATVFDATERVESDRKLRENEDELRRRVEERTVERDRVWRNSRDLILVAAPDGRLHAVSPSWTRILGHPAADVVGRSFCDFIHPDDLDASQQALGVAAGGGEIDAFENRYITVDGDVRRISWQATREGGFIYSYGRDVTDARTQEAALREAEEKLFHAQKMEALGQLTGGIAHDFNNLLTIVTGNLDMARRSIAVGDEPRSQRAISHALQGAERAAALTSRLLTFARRQPLEQTAIDLATVVGDARDMLARSLTEAIDLRVRIADDLPAVCADRHQLENVLLNLAVNARDAMPDGGRFTLAAEVVHLDEEGARSANASPGAYVELTVSDTGTGMPKDVLDRAFEPFFTTKAKGQGTGLGLAMVYGFAQQSGGTVRIESRTGEGTAIRLLLPVDRSGPAAIRTEAIVGAAREDREVGTILVVEDQPEVAELASTMLEDVGYSVIRASDGAEAIERLKENAAVDLVFSDIVMPGTINGIALARRLAESHPQLKVLLASGYSPEYYGSTQDFPLLSKPYRRAELLDRVRSLLNEAPRGSATSRTRKGLDD